MSNISSELKKDFVRAALTCIFALTEINYECIVLLHSKCCYKLFEIYVYVARLRVPKIPAFIWLIS